MHNESLYIFIAFKLNVEAEYVEIFVVFFSIYECVLEPTKKI